MTSHDTRRPPACHYDRQLRERVTRHHRDDCPTHNNQPCSGRDGCAPCTAPHCVTCGRNHSDNAHPLTCSECVGTVRDDLGEILWLSRHLRWQAVRGSAGAGLLNAAAPIPGGDALVLYARAGADLDHLIWSKTLDDDHRPKDPVPILLPLAAWDTQWRTYLGHQPPARPSVHGIVDYLRSHLTRLAQASDGPDWQAFTTDMTAVRRELEAVLHDEQDPEQGVDCFECGRTLVRRWGKPKPCRHTTPAKKQLAEAEHAAARARDHLATIVSYPELGAPTWPELLATKVPTALAVAARRPCPACVKSRTGQGGIEDPSVGQSWECLGCRKRYTPGQYAGALRHMLLTKGPDGDGWTHIAMAASAASTQTGVLVPPATVRKWGQRGKVKSLCRWSEGARFGVVLVYWPDVADEAAAYVERHYEAERKRQVVAAQAAALQAAAEAGEDPYDAGRRLGFHPARVARLVHELRLDEGGRVTA